MQSVLSGTDTLALLPTGGGKSLCYQVPGMLVEGICLVISPLIALMKDQVEQLRRRNITAYALYSGMSRRDVIQTFRTVAESNCKFLYVSPERLETALFKEYLPALRIDLVAVDEAHCVSQWGYDFRPPYLRIPLLREELRGIPVLALTASATPEVQEDICDKLSLPGTASPKNKWQVFRQSFERPNLSYRVENVEARINNTIEILRNTSGTAIVYCKSRKRTQEIANLLRKQGIAADFYHAGLPQEERSKKQDDWINNKLRVIVCTNAFGMGIDKPDVRVVIHADIPDCLENYYQEAGRAGRDGKSAEAILLYHVQDIGELEELVIQRFPPLDTIRTVYQAIANYLQLPSGTGKGEYYDFDFHDFLAKFKLNSHAVLYSIKALEQDGWISFNEQVFAPSRVRFITNKEHLYGFETRYPVFEPLIKTLLRSYEGIFDYPASISEKMLAGLLRKQPEEIRQLLTRLNDQGIIAYDPQKDKPQLGLQRDRIPVAELTIDMRTYEQRKQLFILRTRKMIEYIQTTTACRSQLIGQYFGDTAIQRCGHCDNCKREHTQTLDVSGFADLEKKIMKKLEQGSLSLSELQQELAPISPVFVMQVIRFLAAENRIITDVIGKISPR